MRRFLVLLLAVSLTGCSSWRMVAVPPDERRPADVRAELTDDTTVELKQAYARGDTLYGLGQGSSYYSTQGERQAWDVPVSIAMSEIESLEQRKPDGRKTGVAILGGTLFLGAIAGLIVVATTDWSDFGPLF